MNKDSSIGIFDSGIGGLTVFKEVARSFPHENIVYLGDTARVPFGTKSRETVIKYTLQNTLFLLDQDVKAVIIACNTASAYGLEVIENYFRVPVIGVIEPGAEAAVKKTRSQKVGVIGTEGTIRSAAYEKALRAKNERIEIIPQACPLLVPLAEEGRFEGGVVGQVVKEYLEPLKGIDTLILGCTHYPLFKGMISDLLGPDVALVDSAEATAGKLGELLAEYHLARQAASPGKRKFFSTDSPERMQKVGRLFLEDDLSEVQQVDIT